MSDPLFSAESAPPRKLDPEAFELRGRPGRVTRFRRGIIIGIAGAGSVAIMGIAWLALRPASLNLMPSAENRGQIMSKAPADVLAIAPRSYDEVPQLGPPLPGDLGRPILAHQRQGQAGTDGAGNEEIARQAIQRAEAERQRVATEGRQARESGVLMQLAGTSRLEASQGVLPDSTTAAVANTSGGGKQAVDPERDPNGQQRKLDFLSQRAPMEDVNPNRITSAASPYMLSAGSIIAASLVTGLDSDLPGLVTAQVTENCYDSATGRVLLIPQGARLMGNYDSVVAFGQTRALVVWQRIIFPDGSSIHLDNAPASDLAGYAGLADRIDLHSWQLLKGIALSTVLGVGTELSLGSNESDLVGAMREATQQSVARAGGELVTRNLDVQPTIRVRPGWPFRIIVHKDLVLQSWRG